MSAVVSTDWLAARLENPQICVLDGSWYLPSTQRDPVGEFTASRIPGARFFDIAKIKDDSSDLPHMLPDANTFERAVQRLGVDQDSLVVVYDGAGVRSSTRVWWMFRAMGFERVYVLDGGLPKWTDEGRAVVNTQQKHMPGNFKARFRPALLANWQQVLERSPAAQVLDARAASRFSGQGAEPRKGLRSGHMPGAINLPHDALRANNGTLKSAQELTTVFESVGVDVNQPVITSCGSGITACVLALALYQIGVPDAAVYDGSWTEWGGREDLPIKTG